MIASGAAAVEEPPAGDGPPGPPPRGPLRRWAAARPGAEGTIAAAATGAAVVALALAAGGYGPLAVGAVAIAAWTGVLALALARPIALTLPGPLAVAAGALLALAALTALTLARTPDPGAAFEDLVRTLAYLGILILAGLVLRTRRVARGALAGIAAGVVAVALLALAARLLGLAGGGPGLAAGLAPAAGRLSYPIGYWNALGALLALAVPILIQLAGRAPGRLAAGLATAGLVPVLLAAYMTSSRGALLAAALGALVVIARERNAARPLAALLTGMVAALPSCLAAGTAEGILSGPWQGTGREELLVAGTLLAGIAAASLLGPAAVAAAQAHSLRIRPRVALAAVAVLVGAAVAVAGPGELAGDFRAPPPPRDAAGAVPMTASGSGRAQFWDAALDAFSSEPLRGIGSGGYESWWNAHGTLDTPTRSAHSEPLELLAELGLPGLGAFAALVLALLWAARRAAARGREAGPEALEEPGGGEATAALGVLAAVSVGVAIDWTWDVPAVIVPALFAAGALAGPALSRGRQEGGERRRAAAPRRAGAPRWPGRLPAPGAPLLILALAAPALWAGAVLALSAAQLDTADDALATGRLSAAAAAARSAAAIEPWDSEPWLTLAAVERAAGDLPAARRAVGAAIARAPDDLPSWLLAGALAAESGERRVADAYASRVYLLAPRVVPRVIAGHSGPG